MGSLMDGIEVADVKQKASKAAASASEPTKTIKLAVAIVGLLVGGVLIAWNLGVFGGPEAAAVDKNLAADPQPQTAPASAAPTPRNVPPPLTGAEQPKSFRPAN